MQSDRWRWGCDAPPRGPGHPASAAGTRFSRTTPGFPSGCWKGWGRRAAEDRLSFDMYATSRPPVRWACPPVLASGCAWATGPPVGPGPGGSSPSGVPPPPIPHRPPPRFTGSRPGFPSAGSDREDRRRAKGRGWIFRETGGILRQGVEKVVRFPSPLWGGVGVGVRRSNHRARYPHPETGPRPVSDLPSRGRLKGEARLLFNLSPAGRGAERKRGGEGALAQRSSPSPDCGQRLAFRSPGLHIPLPGGERERRRQSFPSPLWGGVRGGGRERSEAVRGSPGTVYFSATWT